MRKNARELRAERQDLLDKAASLIAKAESEGRDFTLIEQNVWNGSLRQAELLLQEAVSQESLPGQRGVSFESLPERGAAGQDSMWRTTKGAVSGEERAFTEWVRTGQKSELLHGDASEIEMRAVDSTMNITTSADGGYAVPTGLFPSIIARRNELMLATKLGCQPITGEGTTVNVPIENADPNVFATTAEQDDAHAQNYQRDAAQLNVAAMTLVKKTKKLEITEELFDDEAAGLLAFVVDHIGRAQAKTHNAMLLTEVAANGTSLKTFAAAAAIAAGEPEDVVFGNIGLSHYLEDGLSVAFVMRSTTYGDIISLTGNERQYAEVAAAMGRRTLLSHAVHFSDQAAAIAASAKSVYFGNWRFVGLRQEPAIRIIRDAVSVDGLVILKYSFRAVYKVLQAAAIGFGVHPSA